MYLEKISEFSSFLSRRDHPLKAILDHLVRVVLVPIEVESIIFFQAGNFDQFFPTGHSGISKESEMELAPTFSLLVVCPASDAIQKGIIVWIDGTEGSLANYPLLSTMPILVGDRTIVSVPIFVDNTPVAAMDFFFSHGKSEDEHTKAFLNAIGHVFSMYFFRNVLTSPDEVGDNEVTDSLANSLSSAKKKDLTERQLVILRLISEERTNLSISHFLGYSESTIRQEIMKIFAILGCSTRSQAAVIFKNYNNDQ